VLFWLPTTSRETNLHAHLVRTGVPDGLTVATAGREHATGNGGPAGPVWRLVGAPGRVRLADLAVSTTDGDPWDG